MERAEIKFFADYIEDLEERLYLGDYDHISIQAELPYLCQLIRLFMDDTFISRNKHEKVLLATLKMRARKCKEFIEERMALKN
jgi:hypothetical protein